MAETMTAISATMSRALSSIEAMPVFASQKKPHFFRIFFHEHHGSQLKIPAAFEKHITFKKHEIVSLIGPSQSAWTVDLITDDDGMFFRNGWYEFVVDHTLGDKEFLLFTYVGNLHFTVKIFGGNACEKEKALQASPYQDITIIGDSQTLKKSLVSVVEDLCPPPSGDYLPINAETAVGNCLAEAELGCLVRTPDRSDKERPHAANPSNKPYWSESQDLDDRTEIDGLNKHMHSESSRRKRGRPKKIDIIKESTPLSVSTMKEIDIIKESTPLSVSTMKEIDIIKQSTQLSVSTMKEIVSVSDEETEDMRQELTIKEEPVEFIESPSTLNVPCLRPLDFIQSPSTLNVPCLQPVDFIESPSTLNVPCLRMSDTIPKQEIPADDSFKTKSLSSEKRVTPSSPQLDNTHSQPQKRRHSKSSANRHVSVRSRIGILVSNRRPVTPDEVKKAYESARSFASEKPSVLVVMRDSHVYRGFYLNLPCTFVRDHLPTYSTKLTLWSPSGEPWEVNYVAHRGYGGLSARWSAFALAHNLEVDDVCVFELFNELEMRVHIFRVVEEITPLTNIPLSTCQD